MPAYIPNYYIVIPVFNPSRDLVENITTMEGATLGVSARILLVDDALKNARITEFPNGFPSLQLIEGDGSLWWGGAIRLGMETTLRLGARVVFWLNHVCVPVLGTIKKLYKSCHTSRCRGSFRLELLPRGS